MSTRMVSTPHLNTHSIEEEEVNSLTLEPSAEDVAMMSALEQAVKLSQELAIEYKV
jgi:hypothetical protein